MMQMMQMMQINDAMVVTPNSVTSSKAEELP
jgi:hypothetical protein